MEKENLITTTKIHRVLRASFLLLMVLFMTSCEDEEDDKLSFAPPFANKEFCFESFNGGDIPFKTVDIDANNFSRVDAACMIIFDDGEWTSTIDNTQVVDGVSDFKIIRRFGTYSTAGAQELNLVNENGDEGNLSYVLIPGNTEDDFEYKIIFTDNGGSWSGFIDAEF